MVIVGGGVIGSSIAYFLAAEEAFRGTVAVVERDPSYARSSTGLSVGGIRQQFSTPENVSMSLFSAHFIREAHDTLSVDEDKPEVSFTEAGYLFLATERGMSVLRRNHTLQRSLGADVVLLAPEELRERFPWLSLRGLAGGSLGISGEGWLDPYSLLMAFKKKGQSLGVAYLNDEVVDLARKGSRIESVRLTGGGRIGCGTAVNAAGPEAAAVAALAGIRGFPVRPRKRFVYRIHCREQLAECPLTIDPTGVYFRPEGVDFLCGVSPPPHRDPDCEDLEMEYDLFEEIVWPALAHRVPAFEAVKLGHSWAGHYAYNTWDQNAILGAHPEVENFVLANGFSGHGLQQSPAVGRAVAELVTFGEYRTLDLRRLSFARLTQDQHCREENVV